MELESHNFNEVNNNSNIVSCSSSAGIDHEDSSSEITSQKQQNTPLISQGDSNNDTDCVREYAHAIVETFDVAAQARMEDWIK